MKDITNNEMKFLLTLFKSPKKEYNARNLAIEIGISPMGALKIAGKLQKEDIIIYKQIGRAKIYSLNSKNEFVQEYIRFLLKREAEQMPAHVKMWVNEIKKIKNAEIAILFGSILRKKDVNDIDVLFVVDQKRFSALKKEIEDINGINISKIHPLFQSKEDIISNIKKEDKALLAAIKGVAVIGEDKLIALIKR